MNTRNLQKLIRYLLFVAILISLTYISPSSTVYGQEGISEPQRYVIYNATSESDLTKIVSAGVSIDSITFDLVEVTADATQVSTLQDLGYDIELMADPIVNWKGAYTVYLPLITNNLVPSSEPITILTNGDSILHLTIAEGGSFTFGTLAGIANEDIFRFIDNDFELVFDGSDVGVLPSIDAFHVVDDTTILFSVRSATTLNGLAVTDADIVQFTATSLGDTTAGTFSMYFDGSDVELTTSSEDVDAFSILDDGRLLISTVGNPAVTGVSSPRDEDILVFDPTNLGDTTSGSWDIYFDSSDEGLSVSNDGVDGLAIDSDGVMYFSARADFTATGVSGDGSDVFYCDPVTLGITTDCNFVSTYFFDSDANGLTGSTVDGIGLVQSAEDQPIVGLNATNDGPTTIGDSTTLSASVSDGNVTTYTWNLGDGTIVNGTIVDHTYSAVGEYTAMVTAENSLGSVTASTTVTVVDVVVEAPVANFSSSSPTQLGDPTSFINSSTGTDLSYEWNFGDGSPVSTEANPTHTYAEAGIYTVLMTAINTAGSSTISDQVVVTSPPAQGTPLLYMTFSSGGSYDVGSVTGMQNEDIISYDGTNFEMVFDGSDVGVLPSVDAIKIVDEDTILMSFRSGTTVGDLTVSDADIVQFDAISLGDTTAGTFSLYFDGSDVELTMSSEDVDGIDILEDGRLLISTTGNPSVTGLSSLRDEDILAFTPSSLGDTTAGTWAMYFDAGDVGLTTSNEGINGLAQTTDSDLYLSTVGSFAVTGLSGDDEDVFMCELTSEGDTTACTFDPTLAFDGDGFGLSGNELDGLDYSEGGDSPSGPAPVAGFTSTSPDEVGEVTSFTNSTTGSNVSYEWSFGDGATSTEENPSHTYAVAGDYTVVMIATNSGGSDTASATVTITDPPPTPDPITGLAASNDGPTEVGQSTSLSASVTGGTNVNYLWSFGDGQNGTGASVNHTYAQTGVYTATVFASNEVSSEIATTLVQVVDQAPVAIFSSSSPDQLGETTSFTNSSLGTNLSYEWDFGDDSAVSTEVNPTHTYAETGTYTVLMTASNGVGSSTMSEQIEITSPPAQDALQLYLTFLNGGTYTVGVLTNVQNEDIVRYDGNDFEMVFDGSDVGVVGSIDAFHVVDEDTILLSVRAATTLGGLAVTDADIVQFDATSLGETTAGTFSMYFDGSDVELTTSSEDVDGIAILEDGRLLISTTGNPDVTGLSSLRDEDILAFTPSSLGDTTAGTWAMYFDAGDVGLTTSDEGITGIFVTSDNELYLSTRGSFAVSGLSGADEDVFKCSLTSEGDTTACDYDPALVFDGDAFGLDGNDIEGLSLFAPDDPGPTPPVAGFTSSSPDELGQVTSFVNTSTGSNLSYEWSFGDGATSTDENPTHTYAETGTFIVLLTATNTDGSSTASQQIIINDAPPVTELVHPYIAFTPAELATVKAAVQVIGDPRQDMLASLEDGYLADYDSNPALGNDMFLNAVAYAVTEDDKYLTRSRATMLDFVTTETCWDKSSNGQCRRDRIAGINMIDVGMTYDILYQSLSESDRQTVRDVLFHQGCMQYEAATWGKNNTAEGWSNWWYNAYTNNHYTSSLAGLAMVAMVLEPEEDLLGTCSSSNKDGASFTTTVSDWLDYSIDNFNTAKIVWDEIEDGHWPEGDIYQTAAFAELTVVVFALDRLHGTDFATSPIIEQFPQYYLYDSAPNQRWNNIQNAGDATSARRRSFRFLKDLRMLARLNNDEVAQGLADEIIADLGGRPKSGGSSIGDLPFKEIAHELFFYDPTVAAKRPDELAIHRSQQMTDAEEVYMWSDWGDNALVAALHSGPPGGDSSFDHAKTNYNGRVWAGGGQVPQEFKPATAHVHADSNGFYLYGNGTYLIPEVGVYRDDRALWASSTTSHNTITVGGKDQIGGCLDNTSCTGDEEYVPYGNADLYHGKDEYWNQANVGITTFATAANYDFTVGDATDAYASSEGVDEFTRNIMFVEKSYFVMMDDIRLSSSNQVDWHMHTQDGASLEGDWVKGLADNDNVIGIKVLAPSNFSFNTSAVDVEEQYDYTLQHLDSDLELHELTLQTTGTLPRFITVFYPSTNSTWDAKPTVNLLNETNDGASVEVVHQSSEREVTLVNYGDTNNVSLGDYTLDGKAASISFDSSGQRDGYFLAEGTSLKDSSLVTSAGSQYSDVLVTQLPAGTTFEANFSGTDLTVSGSGVTQFAAYAPVTVQRLFIQTVDSDNRVSITEIPSNAYTQVGDYIYYNVAAPDTAISGVNINSSSPTELGQATDLSVSVSTGTNIIYDWNLGDGTVISNGGTNVSHSYAAIGSYTVEVMATNGVGSETASVVVEVVDPTPPPADEPITGMNVTGDSPTEIGQSTALNVTVAGGTNITYDWNLGDGTVIIDGGAAIDHTYGETGVFTVLITGTNNAGMTTASTGVTIEAIGIDLLGPAEGSTQAQPQFDWEDVTGATNYQIQMSDSDDFSTLLLDQAVLNSDYTFTSIQTGQYFWRVIVNGGLADGLQSEVRSMQLVNYNGDDDGDVLPNGWELHGYDAENDGIIEVDLPALGANYRHKDIFVEMDYMERASATNGLAPNQNVIDQITAIFANAPVSNPDGVDGINIHLELDDLVPYDKNIPWDDGEITEFMALKDAYYDTNNQKIYHYMIWVNRYGGHTAETPVTIGVSKRVPGEFFFVSLGHFNGGNGGTDTQKVAAFVHELGHNLGFGHGGGNTRNYKPNYFSAMNYWWALAGIPDGTAKIDYQGFTLPTLDESNLDETVGLNGGGLLTGYTTSYYCPDGSTQTVAADGPIDWNCDGDDTDTGIQVDLNDDGNINSLSSQNDWDSIVFDGGGRLGP